MSGNYETPYVFECITRESFQHSMLASVLLSNNKVTLTKTVEIIKCSGQRIMWLKVKNSLKNL